MSSMDLEKLKMTGAGRALAVLTSGGDAQGDLKRNIKSFYLHVLGKYGPTEGGEGLFTYRWVHVYLFF